MDILCELRYRHLCVIEKWPKYSNIIKVSKVAKIRNRYNQVPHLTQIRYFITSDRQQSRRLWTIDERGSQIARIYHLSPVRQTNCNPKSLFLTVFDLRSSIASTFSIATYPVCAFIQRIRNRNNLKQELGVIYIFQSCFCWKKICFHTI